MGGNGEKEEDRGIGWRGEGGDDGLCGYGGEAEGVGEGDELGVVLYVFGDAGVVATCWVSVHSTTARKGMCEK